MSECLLGPGPGPGRWKYPGIFRVNVSQLLGVEDSKLIIVNDDGGVMEACLFTYPRRYFALSPAASWEEGSRRSVAPTAAALHVLKHESHRLPKEAT